MRIGLLQLRCAAVLAAAFVVLTLGTSREAFALSNGCSAVNAGGFTDTESNGYGSFITISDFAVGDKITFTIFNVTPLATWELHTYPGGAILDSSTVAGTKTYTVTGNSDTALEQLVASDGSYVGSAMSVTATCTPAVTTPADSLKLRALQIAVTPLIAQISGQAITGAVDNAIEDGFNETPQPLTPNGNGFTFNFGAEGNGQQSAATSNNGARDFVNAPDRRANRIDDAFSALAYSGQYTKAPPKKPTLQRDWLGWVDVRGTSVDRRSTGNDLKGDQINATAGLTRKLTPNMLVGVFGGYERFDYTSDALTGRLKGDGWTVGSYFGWRFTSTIRFDAAVARSGINFDGTAGTASATFPGSRWLASGGLTGTYRWQAVVFQPSARVYAMWEHENGYTDSLGIVQDARNFTTGRASGGAKFSYPFIWTSTINLAPYAGVYGDYYFTSDNASSTGLASTPLLQGWSARVTSGLDMKFRNGGTVSLGGELGGIGSSSHTTMWTYRARGSVPF